MPEKNKIEDIFDKTEKTPVSTVTQVEGQSIETKKVEPKFKKKISFKKIVCLIIIFIIIIAIIFGLWFVFSKIKEKSLENNKAEVPVKELEQEELIETPIDLEKLEDEKILDSDRDGLTNAEEDKLGTNKYSLDSDEDGLFDKEEIKIYLTDPLNSDSDEDGILDGEEVKKGSDPNDSNPDAKLLDLQKEIEKLK